MAFSAQKAPSLAYEEIVVRLEVPRLLQRDITAQYRDTSVYLPLLEIFSLLDINTEADFQNKAFSGYLAEKGNKYIIDLAEGKAKFMGREMTLDDMDYILTPTDLFLSIPVYDSLFRMKMTFNFSGLSIYLPLNKDFPAYQKLARKLTHQEFMASSALKKDLLRLPYKRVLFGGGVADWAITTSPIGGGGHYGSLSLGGMALGGDLAMDGTANSM
ncbi:MAG: hypothetical protein NTV06_06475, partial [candidate division Zixibacteria bacterium]|nr:hypothetical protein [candidate division Zixibacteria bacterium]